jgi:hypothetical protein
VLDNAWQGWLLKSSNESVDRIVMKIHLRFDIEQVANSEIIFTLKHSFYGCSGYCFAP